MTVASALAYAARGWPVFPCSPATKKPLTEHGYKDASRDEAQVRAWWRSFPDAMIGIPTGAASGFWALDVDVGNGKDGFASLAALEQAHDVLPPTLTSATPRGGRHLLFKRHDGIRNSASQIADGIDVRGDGGYVILPPSVCANHNCYTWLDGPEEPAEAPAWLLDLVSRPKRAAASATAAAPLARGNGSSNGAYARAALEHEVDAVAKAPPGQRNHTLNRASYSLHQLVACDALSEAEVQDRLFAAATACGLVQDDGADAVRATIVSGATAGLQQPRTVPERSARPQIRQGDAMKDDTVPPGCKHDVNDTLKTEGGEGVRKKRDRIATTEAVGLTDFYAYMPEHKYICAPSREPWPAASVNARIPPIPQANGKAITASNWLDANAAVEQMTWAPGEPMLIKDRLVSDGGFIARPGWRVFNLYRPAALVPRAGDVTPWLDLINKVFPAEVEHILLWLAQRVQRPYEKINYALVLGGKPGIGKDTILEPVKQAVGPWNFAEVSPKQVLGRFNGFLKSVILRINEARDLGEFDRYAFFDHMKQVIAAPPDVLRVDEKNLHEYYIFNLTGVIITTNHKTDGIYLPADDRRHFVAWSSLSKDDFAEDYWRKLYSWYGNGGNEAVAAYLAKLDLSGFDAKAPPPKTSAFWEIANANRAPEDAELADVLDDLGQPDVVTLDRVASQASALQPAFAQWLRDKVNARRVPHRFEDCGYVAVRNPGDSGGRWKISGRRHTVYGKANLTESERLDAAFRLAGTR